MDEMAKHGNGTYDHEKQQWKVRTKEVRASATIRQLREMFKEEIPASERESRPYWLRYLKAIRQQVALRQADEELEAAKLMFADREPGAYSPFEKDPVTGEVRRKKPIAGEILPILNGTAQALDPNTSGAARDTVLAELQRKINPPVPDTESLKKEIETYVARYKKKKNKQWYDIQRALDLFFEATGNISLKAIDVHHYRKFLEFLDREQQEHKWTDRTKQNRQRVVHTFLKHLECDHEDLRFPFIRNKKYRIHTPPPEQIKYTLEQVRLALQHATGLQRVGLMFGLNCGFYWSDIAELQPKHFDGTHITKARAKNKRDGVQKGFMSKWKLWPEAVEVLQYGFDPVTQRKDYKAYRGRLERAYQQLREKFDLPEQMALRKTVAQWIQELAGEEESRILYRAEGYGTHYDSYVCNLTPDQVGKLDRALDKVREKIFG
jgi:hypothetical protein